MDEKLLEKTRLLHESLLILKKSMVQWDRQLSESSIDKEEALQMQSILQEHQRQLKDSLSILGVERNLLEVETSEGEQREEHLVRYCEQKIKYYKEQNKKLELDLDKMHKDFTVLEGVLGNYFKAQDKDFESLK